MDSIDQPIFDHDQGDLIGLLLSWKVLHLLFKDAFSSLTIYLEFFFGDDNDVANVGISVKKKTKMYL